MAELYIPHFLDGLNVLQHPTRIRNTEVQALQNMEVRPTNISDTLSYLTLGARNSYKRLHTDNLSMTPRNLIEFVQRVSGGSGAGTQFLVTGGQNSTNFEVRYLKDGATTTTQISSNASTDQKRCEFFIYNEFLFYTDGNVVWRKWDGVTDSASGFTTKTKSGIIHKFRAFYGNDVTNSLPNRLYYSDVGTPETVVTATSYFTVGDQNDPIIGLVDQVERLLIVKQKSTWVLYVDATIAKSTLLELSPYKGSNAPLGAMKESTGTYVSTINDGVQKISGNKYEPTFLQIYNQLKGFQNSVAALGWNEDQVLLATLATSASARNDRVYVHDLFGTKMFQHNMNLAAFCSNRGILTFGGKLKAVEDDGTNKYIVELDQIASVVESTITCKFRTKDFPLGKISSIKKLTNLNFSGMFPDNSTVLTIRIYKDNGTSAISTATFTPSTAGFNRKQIDLLHHIDFGHYLSIEFEYVQDATIATKFTIFDLLITYEDETRMEA